MGASHAGDSVMETVVIYQSMTDMLRCVEASPRHHPPRSSFGGYKSTREACEYIRQGATPQECERTQALLSKINDTVQHRQKMQTVAAPSGSRVVVPDVLAGMPFPMRRRVSVSHDLAPVRVVVETLVSSGVTVRQLEKRGAAVAALAMRLGETRPVELWASWGGRIRRHDALGRVKLDTNPLTLAEVVAVMTTPMFARNVVYAQNLIQAGGIYGSQDWAWAWNRQPNDDARDMRMREKLMLEPQDIFIPGGYISEADQFATDPVAWVESYVASQRETEAN